ncbi:VanZ family protein [Neobacillus sp. OS1-32]|jgi:glycopeptide antibiotics resistance protein|uniref:VanZ family protein n=1 Tax=Neobacillus sp. OS1-32 TaxID=3070682 RepID=UPI0027DEC95E|nr:VanZ family protein [Neobacillus sp. OS1-32]WML28880.1 VanZ family protein [Neobacillus sp. OS1-32]
MSRLLEAFIFLVIPFYIVYSLIRFFILKRIKINWFTECKRFVVLTYFLLLIYFVWIIPAPSFNYLSVNFLPFKTIYEYINNAIHSKISLNIAISNILGNILLTFPIGFLIPLFSVKVNWKKILLISFLIPFIIELGQVLLFFMKLGSRGIDVDDIILNSLGIILGYNLFLLVYKKASYLKKYSN